MKDKTSSTPAKKNGCGCFGRKKNRKNVSSEEMAQLLPPVHAQNRQQPPLTQQRKTTPQTEEAERNARQQQLQKQYALEQELEQEKRPLSEALVTRDAEQGDFVVEKKGSDPDNTPRDDVIVPTAASLASLLDDTVPRGEPGEVDTSCWANRPCFVELTIFLYATAYKASLPIKEQYVYGYYAAKSSPFSDDFILNNRDRKLTCMVSYDDVYVCLYVCVCDM